MAEMRKTHPYHTYDAIVAQPALIEKVLANRTEIERVAGEIAKKDRITFVGIGTSLHAAQIAEQWMRHFSGGRVQDRFEQSFEFIHNPAALDPGDAVIVITHTGTSSASIESLRRARAAGALTVAIVGHNPGEGARIADLRVETCEQEVSFTYTKSYTTALAALAILIHHVAEQKKLLAVADTPQLLQKLPAQMREALACDSQVHEIAKQVARLPRIDIFGAGVGWPTAREAALKIKEASYIAAEGFETEEILHGPFSEVDSRTALVGILQGASTDDRVRQILRAAGELKVVRVALVVPSASHDVAAEHVILLPEVAPSLSAFIHLAPLQLLAYFLAVERGANPDTGRQEQSLHAAASRHYKY
jgi:glutamine---fructose-6-phosphate transaminase (isomerizing)